MRVLIQFLLLILTGIFLLGCNTIIPETESIEWTELSIESHPKGGGYAHKTVKPDGSITGGHLSGNADAPRVFESKSQLTSQDMSKLRSLVTTILAEQPRKQPAPPDQKLVGYTSVMIIFGDGTGITAFAKWKKPFISKEIQAIWDIISKYQVGAW